MTKLSVTRARLAAAMKQIVSVIERRNTIPILANVLLRAEGETLVLRGADLDIEVQVSIPLDAPARGATTVGALRLSEIAAAFPDGATISIEWDDKQAIVKSGRSRFVLPTMPEIDYPDISAGEPSHTFTLPAQDLARLINKTSFAVDNVASRLFFCGIYLHAPEGAETLRAVATNSHILSSCDTALPAGAAGMPGIIIPPKAFGAWLRLLNGEKGEVSLSLSTQKVAMEIGSSRIVSKLVDAIYPDYERAIPKNNTLLASVDLDAMRAAIHRASIMIEDASSNGGAFAFDDDRLKVFARDMNGGEIEEEIEIDYAAAPIRIGLSLRYLKACLGVLDGDRAIMAMDAPGSPCLITSAIEAGLRVVVMPMRVVGKE